MQKVRKQSKKRKQSLQTKEDKRLSTHWIVLFGLVLPFFLVSPRLNGQSQTDEQKDSAVNENLIQIGEIEVQAFRYAQKLKETPGAIAIIPAIQLQQIPAQQIDFAVNQVAGVYMQSGSLNTNRLTIRGIGGRSPYASNKVRAYFEDIPLTNGTGETSLEDLDQSLIDKIEIIKGPASGFYGSGLGGTLLFRADQIHRSSVSVDGSLSSYNRQNYRANIRLKQNDWQHAFYLDKLDADGYRENNQTQRTNLSYIGRYNTDTHQFNLLLIQTDLKAFIPSSIDWDTYQSTPRKAASSWAAIRGYEDYQKQMAGFSVQSEWGNNLSSRISLFTNQKNSDELRPFNRLTEDDNYAGIRAIIEKSWGSEPNKLTASIGNESFWERYDWETFDTNNPQIQLSENEEKRRYFNLFTQFNFRSPKLRLSAGLNLNQTNYRYRDLFLQDGDQSADHRFDPIISPRIAGSYSLSSNIAIYSSLGHGFSPPSLEESLMPDGQRNTNIKPETGWNIEFGSRGNLGRSLYYDFSVYYMEIRNLLVARRTDEDAYMGVNAGQTQHPGIELDLTYKWLNRASLQSSLRFSGNYSPYKFKDFTDDEQDYSGNDLTGSPRSRVNVVWESRIKQNLEFLLQYQYTDEIPLRDDNSIYADAFQLLNVTTNYRKRWNQLELICSASVFNLTDSQYASMVLINAGSFGNQPPRYYYPGMPRNFAFRIGLQYRL
ncbi:TonB-dependent receptor [Mangrovibacterium sp.]|uniref:TonB-dependent receptor n=1 Tax=Mangrovibacterium sp. TaxID=1961364 RepID=UPI0035653AF2